MTAAAALSSTDRGSGTVLVLGIVLAVMILTGGLVDVGTAIVTRHRAEAAADLAALAAVSAGNEGEKGVNCRSAAVVAAAHNAVIMSCRALADGSAEVQVGLLVPVRILGMPRIWARARARAGLAPVGSGTFSDQSRQLPSMSPGVEQTVQTVAGSTRGPPPPVSRGD
jgi:secretion/DNA translocation related TadE-like protein